MAHHAPNTGIEVDSITRRLSKLIYPDADLRHQPFEEARLADGSYDVALENIPSVDFKTFDPRFKDWNIVIHDYIFAATVAKIRLGGLILFTTSKGTLDKVDSGLRYYMSQLAVLLGAIRLPNDAFKQDSAATTLHIRLRFTLTKPTPAQQSPSRYSSADTLPGLFFQHQLLLTDE